MFLDLYHLESRKMYIHFNHRPQLLACLQIEVIPTMIGENCDIRLFCFMQIREFLLLKRFLQNFENSCPITEKKKFFQSWSVCKDAHNFHDWSRSIVIAHDREQGRNPKGVKWARNGEEYSRDADRTHKNARVSDTRWIVYRRKSSVSSWRCYHCTT